MKTLIGIGVLVVVGIGYFMNRKSSQSGTQIQRARQIKIDQLESVIEQLEQGKLDYDFFGITSNGTDCIYFTGPKGAMNIEFEVMVESQKEYFEKLKSFAYENGHSFSQTTYGNEPKYSGTLEAPVLVFNLAANRETITEIGKEIMKSVFGNTDETIYEVVP